MTKPRTFDNLVRSDLEVIENNARMFATITSEANQIMPLLTQKFEMRIKGSSNLSWSINKKSDALLLGKWIEVTVDWDIMQNTNLIAFSHGEGLIILTPSEFKEHITQKGLAPKMFDAWILTQE